MSSYPRRRLTWMSPTVVKAARRIKPRRRRKPVPAFGEQLRTLRVKRGLTLRALADLAGTNGADSDGTPTTAAAISRIELGQRLPRFATLQALAVALDARIVFDEHGCTIEPQN